MKLEVKLHTNFKFFVISLCLLSARRDLAFLFLNSWEKKIQVDKVGLAANQQLFFQHVPTLSDISKKNAIQIHDKLEEFLNNLLVAAIGR